MSIRRRELARRIHGVAAEKAKRERTTYRFEVIDDKPMTLEMVDGGVELEDDDFEMTQMVRLYDKRYGIAIGDHVLMVKDEPDWLMVDVLSDNDDVATKNPVDKLEKFAPPKVAKLTDPSTQDEVRVKVNEVIDLLRDAGLADA